MPERSGDVREHVGGLALEGMSVKQIDEHVNSHRNLSEAEQELVYLPTYHSVAEVKGHY